MRVLLFVLHACMVRVSEGTRVTEILVWRWGRVVVVSAGHEYVRGTRGSGIMFSAADVLGMSVVRWMRGVGEVCEMCMCLVRAAYEERGVSVLNLGFTNPIGTGCWTSGLRWCGCSSWGAGRALGMVVCIMHV